MHQNTFSIALRPDLLGKLTALSLVRTPGWIYRNGAGRDERKEERRREVGIREEERSDRKCVRERKS